jgi:hypothetical protein
MRRFIISVLLLLIMAGIFFGCSPGRKSISELRGLMLLENTQLGRNKAFNSRHNVKTRRDVNARYRKNIKFRR